MERDSPPVRDCWRSCIVLCHVHAWKDPLVDQARDRWCGSAVVTVMFCVGSHDWFLASRHRTVSGAANPSFEEASPPPTRQF